MKIFNEFYNNRNEEQAEAMAKYMKNLFPFLGLKKPQRVSIAKSFLKERKHDTEVDWEFIGQCYEMPEREYQYLAIDYMNKVIYLFTSDDMLQIEGLVITKSWWDSVDEISKIVGHITMKYPEVKEDTISKWIKSDNIWLVRISIIYQLKYKDNTDTEFLSKAILYNSKTDEFFINKGIGWALREYSKTNKKWVRDFIKNNQLSKLSIREGSKYI